MTYTYKQLAMAWTAVHDGVEPDAATASTLQLMTNPSFTDQQALNYILNSADGSTALAVLSYQFFTGKSPTKDGLAFLVNSAANPTDLNDPYYAKFNTENRYINFAANLGVQGDGAAAFAGKYGAMNFADYVASIYESIIGKAYATAAGIDPAKAIADIIGRQAAILATAQSAGMITPGMTQAQIDVALKAATAGYLLGEAIKADVGLYASASNNFMVAVATGSARYNTDVTTTYATPAGQTGGHGQPVDQAPTTLPGGTPPPPPEPDPVAHAFTLTTGDDTFTGESLSDTFTGILGTGATLNTNDVLDGAGGDDTLSITSNAAASFSLNPTKISHIEHVRVTATGGALNLDLGGIAFTDLTNTGSTQAVSFNNAAPTTGLAISSTSAATTFVTPNSGLGGNADAITLKLTDVTGAARVTIQASTDVPNEYETLNIVSNGTANSIKLGTDTTQTSLATINISGAAPLTLNFAGATDKVLISATTIDSHTATGGVTIGSYATGSNLTLGAANHTITLGTGPNVVFFGFVDNGGGSYTSYLNTNDTVTATAGSNDTVVVTGAGVAAADLAHVTGVETFRFMNSSGTLTQDVSQLPGGVTLEVDGGDTIAALNHLANNATVNVLNAWQLKTALAADTGADVLTVKLAPVTTAGVALGTLFNTTGATLETLNLVSNGAAGQTAANVITTDNATAAHVLTGAADLTITNAIVTSSFDASAFTGALTITGQATLATNIKGGSGADIITLGTGADTVNAGAGNDKILLGALGTTAHVGRGGDTITTGLGNDTVVYVDNVAAGNGGANYAGQPSVVDFHVGASTADTDFIAFSGANASFQLTPAGGSSSTGLAKGSVSQGLTAGDAMVAQAVAATDSAAAAAANVSFIKLTTTTAFSTDNATTFANAIGAASITGLAADGNYVVSLYDTGVGRMVLAIVNVGGATHDTTLSAADFGSASVAVIGIITMTSGDYASFGANHLGIVL